MSKVKVYWTPLAIKSLQEVQSFIVEHWNEQVLDYFLDIVDRRIEQLKTNSEFAPKLGRTPYRKLVIHKNVSVFYSLESEQIKILLLWDNRQDPVKLKEKLIGII